MFALDQGDKEVAEKYKSQGNPGHWCKELKSLGNGETITSRMMNIVTQGAH